MKKNRLRIGQAKNLIRGSLSNKEVKPIEVLAHVIEQLPPEELRPFAAWIDRYPSYHTRLFPPTRIRKYADLWSSAYLTTTDLPSLLRWILRNLSRQRQLLTEFVTALKRYELSYISGQYSDASDILDQIESAFGLSFWLIETKIALLQRYRGLESQKEYSTYVIEAAPKTVTGYFTFYVSYRNEVASSIERFNTRIIADIDLQEIRDATKLFLKSRLAATSPLHSDEESLCTVLAVEASISIIDGYLAVLTALTQIVRRPEFAEFKPLVSESAVTLDIVDERIRKLVALASGAFSTLSIRTLNAENLYCRGQFEAALEAAEAAMANSPADIDALALAAECYALTSTEPAHRSLASVQSEMLLGLTALAGRTGSLEKISAELEKLAQNNQTLPSVHALSGHRLSLRWNIPPTGPSPVSAIFENSRDLNPSHWRVLHPKAAKSLLAYCRSMSTSITTATASAAFDRTAFPDGVDSSVVLLNQIWGSLYHSDVNGALKYAESLAASSFGPWARFGLQVELYCLMYLGQIAKAFQRAARLCATDEDLHNIVPLRAFLEGKSWDDLKPFSGDISLSIVLDLFWHFVNESEHETSRRNAYDEFLLAHNLRKPSQLISIAGRFDRQELIYFWRNLCVPEVMDVSYDVYESSREILDERINVCGVLMEFDPEHREDYSTEIRTITKYKAIQDGLRDIDRSRVHVNTEAIGRWIARELNEDFNRYKNLKDANVDSLGDSSGLQRAPSKPNIGTDVDMLTYPDKEASSLFDKIIASIKAEYLHNADHGLDAYLSMRVRHGSLSGHLRGPLEERKLIVSRTDDKYAENDALASQIGIPNEQERKAFYTCFADFSKRYDGVIDNLIKGRLQIRTTEKPDGMFGWPVDDGGAIAIVKRQVSSQTSFDDFLVLILTALGYLIRNVSESVRDYIATTIKAEIESAFENLRQSLEHKVSAHVYTSVNSRIADAIPIVQAAIASVAEWFVPVQQKEEAATRTLEYMVDVGIEAARNTHRGFSPVIERSVSDAVFPATTLWDFTEVLLTVLDNVFLHSGSNSPWIKINVSTERFDEVSNRIVIRVENQVRADLVTAASRAKLARIRELLDGGEYRKRVNLEGGTGFLKLKRLVSRNDVQSLTFDFSGDNCFFVELSLVRERADAGGG